MVMYAVREFREFSLSAFHLTRISHRAQLVSPTIGLCLSNEQLNFLVCLGVHGFFIRLTH